MHRDRLWDVGPCDTWCCDRPGRWDRELRYRQSIPRQTAPSNPVGNKVQMEFGLQPLNLFILYFPYALAIIIVIIRLWKRTVDGRFSLDDALITLGMVANTGLTISTHKFLIRSYTGYRLENIPKGAVDKVVTAKLRYINSVIYHPALNLIKISFLVTLIRLESPNKWIRRTLWSFLVITIAFCISITVTAILSCIPVAKFWDKTIPGHCRDSKSYVLAGASTTIITDVLVTIIPTWIVYSLQMPLKSKVMALCFMSLGLFVTAITAYRLDFFVQIFQNPDPVRNENPYNIRTPLSNLEINLSAIATCGPTLKWLLGQCIPFFASQQSRPSGYQYSKNTPSRSNTKRSELEPDITEVIISETNSNEDVELSERVVWKSKDNHSQADARSEEHGILRDEGNENTEGHGRYVKDKATQPVDMV
ncbi:unnamed protein product [Periconia digitata]|uniref:Rhodopsin domain-containing protein n=1 Tax=Periconia digitata TaxID=1303443 RepID=A0A9W4UL62_9PLEO|nr:unnamed protein product [Periconia digitata]